jgi:hypothetical protein
MFREKVKQDVLDLDSLGNRANYHFHNPKLQFHKIAPEKSLIQHQAQKR